jgi:hypothetical protein
VILGIPIPLQGGEDVNVVEGLPIKLHPFAPQIAASRSHCTRKPAAGTLAYLENSLAV